MPFSFTQIEKSKSHTITVGFFFLVLLYFVAIWLLSFLIHNYSTFEALLLGQKASWGNLPPLKNLLILAVALILGTGHWFFIVQGLKERILAILKAMPPDLTNPEQKMFSNIIEELQVATGGAPMEGMIMPSLALNACAITDGESIPVIVITSGLLYKLNRGQLEAVVAHEAGHILNGDGEGATIISAMFETFGAALRGIRFVMEGMFDSSSGGDGQPWGQPAHYRTRWGRSNGSGGNKNDSVLHAGTLILFIVLIVAVVWVVHMLSLLMRMFISREREYRADAVSTRLTRNPMALAEALYIIAHRRHTLFYAADSLETLFIVNPQLSRFDDEEGLFPDLFSTHPPVKNRIKILLSMAHGAQEDLTKALQALQGKEKEKEEKQLKECQTAAQTGKMKPFPFSQIFLDGKILNDETAGSAQQKEHDVTRICPACQGELEVFIASADTPPLEAGITSSGMKPCLDTPRLDAGSIEGFIYEGSSILKCRQCEGVLVKEDAIASILHRKQYVFNERIKNMAGVLKDARTLGKYEPLFIAESDRRYRCEQCKNRGQKMCKRLFNRFYPVEIDKCMACGLTWFDKDELEIMQCIFETRDAESCR